MKAFYCDRFVLPLPETHSFPMAKYGKLRERVLARGIVSPEDLGEPEPATFDQLCLAHHADYVRKVFEGTLTPEDQRAIGFPWSPAMVERSRCSVGATIGAAAAALVDGAAVNLAGGTHHASAHRGSGYCVFNDVAVASRVLRREDDARGRPVRRIAVIDCDVHQGDGTAAIFQDDPSVFTLSLHGEKNFPFRKQVSDLDVPLPDGTGDADYLDLLEQALDEVFARHAPELIFYLAGADPYEGDRLGRLALTIGGLRRRDRLVVDRCEGVPVVGCMGGGYCRDIDVIAEIHANTVHEVSRAALALRG